jgi:integrase
VTFEDAADRWVAEYGGLWEETTLKAYAVVLRAHVLRDLGRHDVHVLTPGLLVAYVGEKLGAGCAPRYVRQMLNVVRQVLDVAVEQGALAANPADRAWGRARRRLAVRHEPQREALIVGTGRQLIDGVAELHADIARVIEVYRSTGVRTAEALGLWEEDCDFDHQQITVQRQWRGLTLRWRATKTRRIRTVPMSGGLALVLHEAIDRSHAIARDLGMPLEPRCVFRSARTGFPWHQRTVTGYLRAVGQGMGLERFSPKAFRHGHASNLMNRGENPKAVQEILGHASLSTTLGYSRHGTAERRLGADDGEDF